MKAFSVKMFQTATKPIIWLLNKKKSSALFCMAAANSFVDYLPLERMSLFLPIRLH